MTETKRASSGQGATTGIAIGVGLVFFLLVVAIGVFWWNENYGPGYYSELEEVRRELKAIPETELLELGGYDESDFPLLRSLENITARVRVAGEVEMEFAGLSSDSFGEAEQLILTAVGPYRIRYRGEGYMGVYRGSTGAPVRSEFAGASADVAPGGDFAPLFPCRIPNVQTALARYREVLETVAQWPETPLPPGCFTTPSGTAYYYWVIPKGSDGNKDVLWNRPFADLQASAPKPDR